MNIFADVPIGAWLVLAAAAFLYIAHETWRAKL